MLHDDETKKLKSAHTNLLLWVLWPIREKGDMAKIP